MTKLMNSLIASAAVAVIGSAAAANVAFEDFDVNAAVLDPTMDMNEDGEVTIDEIIEMNEMVFDINGDGSIDAAERGEAEQWLENELG